MAKDNDWGEPDQPAEGGDVQEEREKVDDRPHGGARRGTRDPADEDTQPIPRPTGVHRE